MDLPAPTVAPAPLAPAVTRRQRLATLVGGLAVTGYVFLVDPSKGGAYPRCPSRLLFGIDCPACGGLRGTHDLLHGHVREALDHNLLLPAYLAVIAGMAGMYLLPLIGRPARAMHPPRWLVVAAVVVVVAFTVARNLPVAGLRFLDSA
jgi:Protein of unknown function (DUF2752)